MKIAVMGAGGVGGFFGGKLASAGHQVAFIARGAHLAALQRNGLRIDGSAGQITLPSVTATDDPASVGPVDLVLMTAKAYDLHSAAGQLSPMLGGETVVLPLLNGVDIAERIGAVIGQEKVLGGVCYIGASIAEPGVIKQAVAMQKIVLGEFSGEVTPRAQAVHDALQGADIQVELSRQIGVEIWSKYIFIAAMGVCALTGSVLGPVLADPDTRALFVGCLEEIEALARKKGIPLKESIVADTLKFVEQLPGQAKPSLALSLELGQKLEVEALNGTAARLGREVGVPTPINQFIYAALKLRADGAPRQ